MHATRIRLKIILLAERKYTNLQKNHNYNILENVNQSVGQKSKPIDLEMDERRRKAEFKRPVHQYIKASGIVHSDRCSLVYSFMSQ